MCPPHVQHIREMIGGGDGAEAPFLPRVVAAMAAGGIGQAIASPLDLVKVRMQGDGRLVAAKRLAKPRYTGLADALVTIARKEGMAGFWIGSVPAIQRAALVNLGELTTCASRAAPAHLITWRGIVPAKLLLWMYLQQGRARGGCSTSFARAHPNQ